MKWINVFFALMLLSIGVQAQAPVEIWSDDFNGYSNPNSFYGCDFINLLSSS